MSLRSLLTSVFSGTPPRSAAPTPQPAPTVTAPPVPYTKAFPKPPLRVPSARQQAVAADFSYLLAMPRNVAMTSTPATTWGMGKEKIRRKYAQRALRLLLRLARQIPPCRNQAETLAALEAKVQLLNRLLPVDWSLNLGQSQRDPATRTLTLVLIRHAVHINTHGAWQICERFAPHQVLLEKPSAWGMPFRLP